MKVLGALGALTIGLFVVALVMMLGATYGGWFRLPGLVALAVVTYRGLLQK